MAAIATAGFSTTDAHLCEVLTVGDFFKFAPGSVLTADGITIVNSGDGLGQWLRLLVPNQSWRLQATWSIDESNVSGLANNENTGIDDTHPLLSVDEFLRRMGRVVLTVPVTVRWMSDTTHYTIDLSSITGGKTTASSATGGFPLVIIGVPTIIRSGTLTGATDAPWTITDTTLATSWTASGCVSTSSGTRLIRKTDGSKSAFIGYENSAKTAQTSPTTGVTDAFGTLGTVAVSFAPGDAYNVYSLPKFPRVTSPDSAAQNTPGGYFFLLDMLTFNGGANQVRNCGFPAVGSFNMMQRGGFFSVYGALFFTTNGLNGLVTSAYIDRTMMMGTMTVSSWGGDLNGATNVVAKAGSIAASHTALGRLGTVYAFDCTNVNGVIFVNNNANVTIDAVHGSGNTQLIINIRDPGCSVNSLSTAASFDATTSAAKPISVVGITYNYADIPIIASTNNASFTTN